MGDSEDEIWEVVGGALEGGILVRTGIAITSRLEESRLVRGALVRARHILGNRLLFRRISGAGPEEGWVSIKMKDKPLLVRRGNALVGHDALFNWEDLDQSEAHETRRRARSLPPKRFQDSEGVSTEAEENVNSGKESMSSAPMFEDLEQELNAISESDETTTHGSSHAQNSETGVESRSSNASGSASKGALPLRRRRPSMDWPLSREEKKSQLLRLYNDDVRAADSMLSSGNKTLEALRAELEAVRAAAGIHKSVRKIPCTSTMESPATPPKSAEDEVDRLRQAVESAAAVLRAILPQDDSDPADGTGDAEVTPAKTRSRSEGAGREASAVAARPALCRTPRESRRPKRKVSFGGQPEEEPTHSPDVSKYDEEDGRTVLLHAPPSKARHASVDGPIQAETHTGNGKIISSPASTGSRINVHLIWLICSLALVLLCGFWAFQMGSRRPAPPAPPAPSRPAGDKTCWQMGFSHDFCCNKAMGKFGNVECWDHEFTYDRCCRKGQEL